MKPTSFSNRRLSKSTDTSSPRRPSRLDDQNPPPNSPRPPAGAYGLDSLLADRIRTLSELAADVQEQIAARRALSQRLLADIEEQNTETHEELTGLRVWPLALNDAVERRRRSLEQQLDTLRHEQREERARAWNDVAQLHRELRDRLSDYFDLQNRIALLGSPRPDDRATTFMKQELASTKDGNPPTQFYAPSTTKTGFDKPS